ncbi:YgjV family protein [Marinoscillum furvescens]|nr:YgjV family protein [Marinoscillum furvescens]
MSAEWIGYLALGFSLMAMAHNNIIKLRVLHALSAISYVGYGIYLEALPLIIGGVLFLMIHSYHLLRFSKNKT